MRKMRKLHLLAAAAAVTGLFAVPASANHWWGSYRWAVVNGVLDVKVNAALTGSGGWATYVNGAVTADWEPSPNLTLGTVRTSTASAKKCSPITGEILVCNELYGLRGWLGIASIWTDTRGRIAKATTKLNDSYFSMTKYNTPAWKRLVACQEIGHNFGLAHQDEAFANVNVGSCMDYTNAPAGGVVNGFNYGPSNEHTNQHDHDQLATMYGGRADGYTTAHSSTSPSSTNFGVRDFTRPTPQKPADDRGAGDSPAEWGTPTHHDEKGRPDVFARPLPDGGQVVTHVFWAPDTRPQDIR